MYPTTYTPPGTTFTYNVEGKLLKQTDPDGKETNYQYDTDGRLIKTVDGNGNAIANQYDDSSSGSGCSSCGGGATTGNQPSKTIFPTFSREFTYDVRGRKTAEKDVTTSNQVITTYNYDISGNLISKTDKEGKTELV